MTEANADDAATGPNTEVSVDADGAHVARPGSWRRPGVARRRVRPPAPPRRTFMSSAETPRFDATAAAQQMLDLDQPDQQQPALPAQAHASPLTTPAPSWALPAPLPGTLTDRGNAKLFVKLYRDQFRHVEGLGWFSWDGYRWKRTGGEKAALWAAGEMAEDMPDTDPSGLFSNRDLHHHKKRTLSTTGMRALLTQAKASPDLSVDPDTLDGDPYALCTPAGVVDLHTGLLRKPDPTRDFHSRATSVAPPSRPRPLAGTASCTTPSATTPKARK